MDRVLGDSTVQSGPSFPTRPSEDLEHARIVAAAGARLFGGQPLEIGHYLVDRLLGAGGMGEVFLAHDRTLGRSVALKVLRTGLGSTERLRNEAQALARLSHPNVVQVHEFGEQEGRAYVVMEYVAGLTLSRWLARARRSWREILAVFRSAGLGLAAAHEVGVIHRDFKPDNVIVGEDGRVRVVDFGLAHASGTLQAGRAGTPAYMAPEQLDERPIDARVDQYAFCVALHEALCGVLPNQARERPRGPEPRWLWQAIRRGLAEDPHARWPDMPRLLAAIDEAPHRRRRGLALAAAAVGALSLAAVLLRPVLLRPQDPCEGAGGELDELWHPAVAARLQSEFAAVDARHGRPAAEQLIGSFDAWGLQWRDARRRSCRARESGLSELVSARRDACLVDRLARVRERLDVALEPDASTLVFAWTLAGGLPRVSDCEDDEALGKDLTVSEAVSPELERLQAVVRAAAAERLAGHPERSREPLARARAEAEALGHSRVLAELLAEQAAVEFMAGSPTRGVELLERAARRAYVAGDDRLVGQLWQELGLHALSEYDDPDGAARWLEQAQDAWSRIDPEHADPSTRALMAYASGALALRRERLDEAERELERALAGPDAYLRPFVLERQALLAEARRDAERALTLREQAVVAGEQAFGPAHPRTLRFVVALAGALVQDDPERARVELARVFDAAERLGNVPSHDLAEALMVSCGIEHELSDLEAALVAARRAQAIYALLGPESATDEGVAYNAIGAIENLREDFAAASEAYARALELLEPALGPDDAIVIEVRNNATAVLLELGRLEEARAGYERTRASAAEDSLAWTVASLGLADVELRSGAPERAHALLSSMALADEARTSDRLTYRMFLALAELRLGRAPSDSELATDIGHAEADDRAWLRGIASNLSISEAERAMLGLGP